MAPGVAQPSKVRPRAVGSGYFFELRTEVAGRVGLGAGELAHQGDEVFLDTGEQRRVRDTLAVEGQQGFYGAEGDVELVKRADGFDLRMVLGHTLTVEEAGGAVVSGAGGDGGGHGV